MNVGEMWSEFDLLRENVGIEWVLRDSLKPGDLEDVNKSVLCGSCPGCGALDTLHISSDAQFFYCDACLKSGDLFSAYMLVHKCSFPEAVKGLSAIVAERRVS
jgi:hypothetical protein